VRRIRQLGKSVEAVARLTLQRLAPPSRNVAGGFGCGATERRQGGGEYKDVSRTQRLRYTVATQHHRASYQMR
jgi:hypothetical protein